MLDKQIIMERVRERNVWLTSSRTAIFAAAVAERKIRYVIGMWINGDGVASRLVDIERLEEDGTTYTMLHQGIPVAPSERVTVPEDWEFGIENPSETVEGGVQLYGRTAGGSLNITVKYWDDDV